MRFLKQCIAMLIPSPCADIVVIKPSAIVLLSSLERVRTRRIQCDDPLPPNRPCWFCACSTSYWIGLQVMSSAPIRGDGSSSSSKVMRPEAACISTSTATHYMLGTYPQQMCHFGSWHRALSGIIVVGGSCAIIFWPLTVNFKATC